MLSEAKNPHDPRLEEAAPVYEFFVTPICIGAPRNDAYNRHLSSELAPYQFCVEVAGNVLDLAPSALEPVLNEAKDPERGR